MAGHSHWANIAHKKAAVDKKRAKIFSKISGKIIAAVKGGGPDPSTNLRLKSALQAGRAANMSNDQIDRAVKRATGESSTAQYEELVYEGYAPGGTAVLLEALTDNRNRTGGEIRSIFSKGGGNLGGSGSVAWQFERMALVTVPADGTTEDDVMLAVLDAGAQDIESMDDVFQVRGPAESLQAIQDALAEADIATGTAEVSYVPKDYVSVEAGTARQVAALLENFEENDDIQTVHSNVEFPEDFEP